MTDLRRSRHHELSSDSPGAFPSADDKAALDIIGAGAHRRRKEFAEASRSTLGTLDAYVDYRRALSTDERPMPISWPLEGGTIEGWAALSEEDKQSFTVRALASILPKIGRVDGLEGLLPADVLAGQLAPSHEDATGNQAGIDQAADAAR